MNAIMIVNEDLETAGYFFEAGSQWPCVFLGMHGDCYRVQFNRQVLHVPQGVVRLEYETPCS
jgi:hypothetical protein